MFFVILVFAVLNLRQILATEVVSFKTRDGKVSSWRHIHLTRQHLQDSSWVILQLRRNGKEVEMNFLSSLELLHWNSNSSVKVTTYETEIQFTRNKFVVKDRPPSKDAILWWNVVCCIRNRRRIPDKHRHWLLGEKKATKTCHRFLLETSVAQGFDLKLRTWIQQSIFKTKIFFCKKTFQKIVTATKI